MVPGPSLAARLREGIVHCNLDIDVVTLAATVEDLRQTLGQLDVVICALSGGGKDGPPL